MLGKDPGDYVAWLISGPSAWGGIPELQCMSSLWEIEIGVVVIQDVEVLMFGHNKGYSRRLYFLFDGTHYNLCITMDGANKVRSFNPTDEKAYQGVLELAKDCKEKGEAIDPAIFSLVCYEC